MCIKLTNKNYILHLLWTWHKPIANCDNSGICLRISSVTRCTPRCCGLKFIFFWNHAELVWIILAEEAMFDLLSLSVASLEVYFVIQKKLSVKLYTTEKLMLLDRNIIIMNKPLVIILKTVKIEYKCRFSAAVSAIRFSDTLSLSNDFGKFRSGADNLKRRVIWNVWLKLNMPYFSWMYRINWQILVFKNEMKFTQHMK